MKEVALEAGGLLRGSSAPALQTFLRRQAGIQHAEANSLGILLSPRIAAVSMSGSSLIVALNALLLKLTRLPGIRRMQPQRSGVAGVSERATFL